MERGWRTGVIASSRHRADGLPAADKPRGWIDGADRWRARGSFGSCPARHFPRAMAAGSKPVTKGFGVNGAYLSALSALAGSAIGGMASIATTWLTQHSQNNSQRYAQSIARRERLYGDFIDEASKLFIDALTHEQVDPLKFVEIYATVGKLRLFASAAVVSRAEQVLHDIGEIYYLPTRDFAKRATPPETELNILQAFSEACREDLRD